MFCTILGGCIKLNHYFCVKFCDATKMIIGKITRKIKIKRVLNKSF